MTDIEKAIEFQKGRVDGLKYYYATYADIYGDCEMNDEELKNFYKIGNDQIKLEELILQALQEKAEREKGCEFCKNEEHRNDSERIFYKEFPHDLNLSTSLSDAHLQIAFDNKSGWVLHFENEYDRMFDDKITHCPMCGRKLV